MSRTRRESSSREELAAQAARRAIALTFRVDDGPSAVAPIPGVLRLPNATAPVADPLTGVRALDGRPLLMVHGRRDNTILPAQATRLFEAAREPKEIQWWDAGHRLPDAAVLRAAAWLDRQLRQLQGGIET